MKTWHKILIGIATVGVTGTCIYYGAKYVRKRFFKKPAADTKKAQELLDKIEAAKSQRLTPEGQKQVDGWKVELANMGYQSDNGKLIPVGIGVAQMGQEEANGIARSMAGLSFSKPGVRSVYGPTEQAEFDRLEKILIAGGYTYVAGNTEAESKAVKK